MAVCRAPNVTLRVRRWATIKKTRELAVTIRCFAPSPKAARYSGVLHRSGNVHDSKGALEFVTACVQTVRERLGNSVRLEARLDSAFFQRRDGPAPGATGRRI